MSWLWWKDSTDELSSSSSSSLETRNTNSTSTFTPTNDRPTPTPSATHATTATTNPPAPSTSSISSTPATPYQPLDPLTESSLPTTLPCTPLFDSAFFCSSLGGHLTSIYRTGAIADCRDNWSRFWFCMRTRAIWDADEKREVIREYNRGIWRESYHGGRNWVLRDGEYRDRTGGMNPTKMTTVTGAATAGNLTGASKYAYATTDDSYSHSHSGSGSAPVVDDNGGDDDVSAPEGSTEKEEGWRRFFRARSRDTSGGGSGGANGGNGDAAAAAKSSGVGSGDNLATGGGSGRYRSSEDVWELRTEPVRRAFDLHPLRDLGEMVIDQEGKRHRVRDLDGSGTGSGT